MTAQWIVKSFFSIYGILRAYQVVYAAPRRSWPFRGLSPTAKFLPPLRSSKWMPCNNYALCIMNYALKEAHGCIPVTTTWF